MKGNLLYDLEMWRYLKPKKIGSFEIRHVELTKEALDMLTLRDAINRRREYAGQKPGAITQLFGDGALWMSDTMGDRRTNSEFVWNADGDVLIAGLGIGLVLLAIQDKPNVRSVLVLEKYQDV